MRIELSNFDTKFSEKVDIIKLLRLDSLERGNVIDFPFVSTMAKLMNAISFTTYIVRVPCVPVCICVCIDERARTYGAFVLVLVLVRLLHQCKCIDAAQSIVGAVAPT